LSWTPRDWRARLASALINHYGKPEKETPPQDEQAQAPEALEVESPQEAHVAEIAAPAWRASAPDCTRRLHTCGGFLFARAGEGMGVSLFFTGAHDRRQVAGEKQAAL